MKLTSYQERKISITYEDSLRRMMKAMYESGKTIEYIVDRLYLFISKPINVWKMIDSTCIHILNLCDLQNNGGTIKVPSEIFEFLRDRFSHFNNEIFKKYVHKYINFLIKLKHVPDFSCAAESSGAAIIGNKFWLKSGSPELTLKEILENGEMVCTWMFNGELTEHNFSPKTLTKICPNKQ